MTLGVLGRSPVLDSRQLTTHTTVTALQLPRSGQAFATAIYTSQRITHLLSRELDDSKQ
jgi:hypothetical protein